MIEVEKGQERPAYAAKTQSKGRVVVRKTTGVDDVWSESTAMGLLFLAGLGKPVAGMAKRCRNWSPVRLEQGSLRGKLRCDLLRCK